MKPVEAGGDACAIEGAETRLPERANGCADTDLELVRRFKEGDKAAFELLYSRYHHKIFSLIRGYLRDPEEVQDVVQEAFVKALRGLPRFQEASAFYTWLYRIAVNTVKNHIVAKKRRPPDVDIDVDLARCMDGALLVRVAEDPASKIAGDELFLAIRRAMSALQEELRHALALREIDGMSYEQIATLLQCPVGTVRSRIFRARKAVDKRIRPLLDG